MTPKKVLVTGSSGYLGSQTVAALALRPDLSVIATPRTSSSIWRPS